MADWINRINLLWLFLLLLGFHSLLYYSLGTNNWLFVALTASIVDTAVVAAFKILIPNKKKGR